MRTTLSGLAHLSTLAFLAPLAMGCSGAPVPRGGGAEGTGSASIALTQVPNDVKCVEIDVTGNPNLTKRFDVTAGNASTLAVDGIALGAVDVSGKAFNVACSVTSAPTTWVTTPVSAIITIDVVADITLTFTHEGKATITGDFADSAFRTVSTFAGGVRVPAEVDGVGASARFNRPELSALDGAGHLYVADGRGKTIRTVDLASGAVTTLAGDPAATGTGTGVDGVGAAATFSHPQGIAYDGVGSLYVTDTLDNTIRKIDVATATVTTVAGTPGATGSADGVGAAAQFNIPYGIAADASGNVYVADSGNSTVRKLVSATGQVTTIAGVAGVSENLDGTGSGAHFVGPGGLATDGWGLYIADGSTIRVLQLSNALTWTLVGDPNVTGAGDGPTGHLAAPTGVAYDGNEFLFITDTTNANVRQYDLYTGILTTVAGTPGLSGHSDGYGPNASFVLPIGISADATNVYVSDTGNSTIRKM